MRVTRRAPRAGGRARRRGGVLTAALAAALGWAIVAQVAHAQDAPAPGPAGDAADAGDVAAMSSLLDGEPSWLMLEQARIALERGEPGSALAGLLKAKDAAGIDVYPEADIALGDFWKAEGELAQAERSYRKALDDLRIAEHLTGYQEYDYVALGFLVRERLADLYRLRENYGLMEEQYRVIVQADRDFSSGSLADRLTGNYATGGLNRALTLYRLDAGFAVQAHAELGWLYYRNGLYEKALPHALFAVVNIMSTVIRELRRVDTQYAFSSVEVTLRDAYRRPNTRAYLEETAAWKALYYLAATSYAGGHPARARETWETLSRSSYAGLYQSLAARQLQRPWIEPPLDKPFRGSTP